MPAALSSPAAVASATVRATAKKCSECGIVILATPPANRVTIQTAVGDKCVGCATGDDLWSDLLFTDRTLFKSENNNSGGENPPKMELIMTDEQKPQKRKYTKRVETPTSSTGEPYLAFEAAPVPPPAAPSRGGKYAKMEHLILAQPVGTWCRFRMKNKAYKLARGKLKASLKRDDGLVLEMRVVWIDIDGEEVWFYIRRVNAEELDTDTQK